jgi:hypothetical protein
MCQHEHTDSFRRGHKRMDLDNKDGDELSSHFKTYLTTVRVFFTNTS